MGESGPRTIAFESWAELKHHITDVVADGIDGVPLADMWFRGQPKSEWPLTSSFDRLHATMPLVRRRAIHTRMLEHFRERGQLVAGFSESADDDVLYALLQHYGAPTKLLDWSTSPYVAAFFAYAGDLVGDDDDDQCAIHVLNTSAPIWRSATGVSLIRTSRVSDQRVFNQHGNFTINESMHASLEAYICEFARTPQDDPQWTAQKWLIPYGEAPFVLRDLELMGISSESMFPGLYGSSRYAYFRATIEDASRG